MKPPPFDYVAARSLDEALTALTQSGDDAKPIAGGQSLMPALNMRLVRPSVLVDVNHAGLDLIEARQGVLRVGATVRQAVLARDARTHPLLVEALPFVGHVVTRNRGTIGGSIAHADGSAEIPLCLAALGGSVVAAGPDGEREIAPGAFFVTHFLTTLQPGELVTATHWPEPRPGEGCAFEELALRAGDYALSMAAVVLRREHGRAAGVRIAVGAVTEAPLLLEAAAAEIEGTTVDGDALRAAAAAASAAIDPPGSIHASPAYLRQLTATLVRRAVARAWERAA